MSPGSFRKAYNNYLDHSRDVSVLLKNSWTLAEKIVFVSAVNSVVNEIGKDSVEIQIDVPVKREVYLNSSALVLIKDATPEQTCVDSKAGSIIRKRNASLFRSFLPKYDYGYSIFTHNVYSEGICHGFFLDIEPKLLSKSGKTVYSDNDHCFCYLFGYDSLKDRHPFMEFHSKLRDWVVKNLMRYEVGE